MAVNPAPIDGLNGLFVLAMPGKLPPKHERTPHLELTILVAILLIAFVCVFLHWKSLTKIARVRAEAFYSHYQYYSRELNKFPLDPATDYIEVVANTIEEAIEVNRLPIGTNDAHSYAFEIVQFACVLATTHHRSVSFRDVVSAAVLLDWQSKKRKKPSRYIVSHVTYAVEAVIPRLF